MSINFKGLILGSAVGDAMGLPREGLSPRRAKKLFGTKIQPALIVIPFIKRLSTCSDDTEHLWITAQALLKTQDQNDAIFEAALARLLKRWVLTLPLSAGKATLSSCFKLCLGISPKKSGMFSAGNGPLMRAAIIGAYCANDNYKMERYLKISTVITHTDPKAYESAWLVAKAASLLTQNPITNKAEIQQLFFHHALAQIKDAELLDALKKAQTSLEAQKTLFQYLEEAMRLKNGVTGYAIHTAAAVIYAWLRYFGDYKTTIEQIILAGGDSDTCAAIVGALAGMTATDIPQEWARSIYNAPLSVRK